QWHPTLRSDSRTSHPRQGESAPQARQGLTPHGVTKSARQETRLAYLRIQFVHGMPNPIVRLESTNRAERYLEVELPIRVAQPESIDGHERDNDEPDVEADESATPPGQAAGPWPRGGHVPLR